jgi:hypothetical protein
MSKRLALVTAVTESSQCCRLLQQHGFTIRVVGQSHADLLLPTPHGSLAYCLTQGDAATGPVAERAALSSRSARRCTVMWICPLREESISTLQLACPVGVNVVSCHSPEEAVEHMLACVSTMVVGGPQGASAAGESERAERAATERGSVQLASLFGVDAHTIDFMLASHPLSSLARITSEEEWQRLLLETDGLVDMELLYMVIDWMQRDQAQLW